MPNVLWKGRYGNVAATLTQFGGGGGNNRYAVSDRAWRLGAHVVDAFGVEPGLRVIDARAERALLRDHVAVACRWRDVMVAIHAMSDDERRPGESGH